MKDTAARNKILEATINSIEIYGIEGCTMRHIAQEAGVALSSLHYYFESKEVLVDKALELAMTNMFDDIENIWKGSGVDHKAALHQILTYLLEGALRFPGITRAGLQPLLMQGRTDSLFIVGLNEFLSKASGEMAKTVRVEAEDLRLKLMQAFSTILFLGIAPDSFQDFSAQSFREEENRAKLVKSVIDGIF